MRICHVNSEREEISIRVEFVMSKKIDEKKLFLNNSCLGRYLTYGIKNKFKQTIEDYKYFPSIWINSSSSCFKFKELIRNNMIEKYMIQNKSFKDFLLSSGTTAFLVINNDSIIAESYFNGYRRERIHRLYSITKSVTSVLIGIAIQEGIIKSINDPIIKYIPELKNSFSQITISHLLNMQSGIKFKEGYFPWKDEIKTYFSPDCRTLLSNIVIEDKIGDFFHYNDYHPLLLSLLLEKTLNISITEFLEEKLWQPLGMEYPACLTIDNIEKGFVKLESGLSCTPIDLAKLGKLFLDYGTWNGKQIIDKKWILDSTRINSLNQSKNYFKYYNNHPWGKWFSTGKGYYKRFWWGYKISETEYDYFSMGVLGQILYISPRKNTIVIKVRKRVGDKWVVAYCYKRFYR
ncbi:MAG: beta-lactamase family protein [Marinifilaceae bacterium]|jgi:CubicO group peptidase (beta-lactamase class C family)|nr:beta-lactamase family protein [Marinifilaceae bacterium]